MEEACFTMTTGTTVTGSLAVVLRRVVGGPKGISWTTGTAENHLLDTWTRSGTCVMIGTPGKEIIVNRHPDKNWTACRTSQSPRQPRMFHRPRLPRLLPLLDQFLAVSLHRLRSSSSRVRHHQPAPGLLSPKKGKTDLQPLASLPPISRGGLQPALPSRFCLKEALPFRSAREHSGPASNGSTQLSARRSPNRQNLPGLRALCLSRNTADRLADIGQNLHILTTMARQREGLVVPMPNLNRTLWRQTDSPVARCLQEQMIRQLGPRGARNLQGPQWTEIPEHLLITEI